MTLPLFGLSVVIAALQSRAGAALLFHCHRKPLVHTKHAPREKDDQNSKMPSSHIPQDELDWWSNGNDQTCNTETGKERLLRHHFRVQVPIHEREITNPGPEFAIAPYCLGTLPKLFPPLEKCEVPETPREQIQDETDEV